MVSAHKVLCCSYAHAANRHVTAHHQLQLQVNVSRPLTDCALLLHSNHGQQLDLHCVRDYTCGYLLR